MHSSGMRTAHLLTASQHALFGGCTCPGGVPVYLGVYLPRGVYVPGGVPAQGGVPVRGYLPRYSPLGTDWQTGAKILPCPKLRLRVVISVNRFDWLLDQWISLKICTIY